MKKSNQIVNQLDLLQTINNSRICVVVSAWT